MSKLSHSVSIELVLKTLLIWDHVLQYHERVFHSSSCNLFLVYNLTYINFIQFNLHQIWPIHLNNHFLIRRYYRYQKKICLRKLFEFRFPYHWLNGNYVCDHPVLNAMSLFEKHTTKSGPRKCSVIFTFQIYIVTWFINWLWFMLRWIGRNSFSTTASISAQPGSTNTGGSPKCFTLPHVLWSGHMTKHQRMAQVGTW